MQIGDLYIIAIPGASSPEDVCKIIDITVTSMTYVYPYDNHTPGPYFTAIGLFKRDFKPYETSIDRFNALLDDYYGPDK